MAAAVARSAMAALQITFALLALVVLFALVMASITGCAPQTQLVLVYPGQPVRLRTNITVPAGSAEVETAKGVWTVSTESLSVGAGWYFAYIPATQPATRP